MILLGARQKNGDAARYDVAIRNAGAEHAITVKENVPHEEMPLWYRASDCLALPSIKEGFGLVAAEALSCGRPVAATLSGGPSDIVNEGQGILVPPEDSKALGDAISGILSGEGIMSPGALSDSARERFSYESVTKRILNVYNEVL